MVSCFFIFVLFGFSVFLFLYKINYFRASCFCAMSRFVLSIQPFLSNNWTKILFWFVQNVESSFSRCHVCCQANATVEGLLGNTAVRACLSSLFLSAKIWNALKITVPRKTKGALRILLFYVSTRPVHFVCRPVAIWKRFIDTISEWPWIRK